MNPAMHSTSRRALAVTAGEVHRSSEEEGVEEAEAEVAGAHFPVSFCLCCHSRRLRRCRHPPAVFGAIGWPPALCPDQMGASWFGTREMRMP